jgi:sec-independent protein translocase protein TatB
MFDISFYELFFVAIIALLVLGPERLPVAARAIGRWTGKARQAFGSVKNEINRELQLDELKQQIKEQERKMDQMMNTQSFDELARETQAQIDETKREFMSNMDEHNRSVTEQTAAAEQQLEQAEYEAEGSSGCDNPVEFEPIPRDSENTIHAPDTTPQHSDSDSSNNDSSVDNKTN